MKKQADMVTKEQLFMLLERAGRPLKLDDILRLGAYSRRLKRDIQEELSCLVYEGNAVRLEGGKFLPAESLKTRRGVLSVQRSGAAFVRLENLASGRDVYIAPEYVGDAWNGDVVEVMLLPMKRGSRKVQEGRVTKVLQRKHTEIVAYVLQEGALEHTVLCRPADARLMFDVIADISALKKNPAKRELLRISMGEKLGDTGNRPLWSGMALSSLGMETDAAAQERFTKLNNGIATEFPGNVVAEAEEAAKKNDMAGLFDLRGEMLVTIDGEDARDFDDAVCVCRMAHGWRLLVAIADVSYYVRPRTALDREARERGNSFYFPMSVEPMLPHVLCNGVCSLKPHEERRCMAVDMQLDEQGNLISAHMVNAVMISRARLTYAHVQTALDNPKSQEALALEECAPNVLAMLKDAADLAHVLIERRARQGSLDFNLPEAEFVLEEASGASCVAGIRNRERLFSHRIIEAFMVRANEAVAEFLARHNAPFIYRVHPSPGAEKLEELCHVLRSIDAHLPLPRASKAGTPVWLAHVLGAAAGTDQAFVVNRLVLRSMMQACYSPKSGGHFGLASSCYCHFTSPIRRYADLVNHRALRYVLGFDTGGAIPTGHKLLQVAEQCNGRERAADDAEREISRRMGCLLLQERIGEYFEGVISGVMPFGFFVGLDGMPVEGMVRVETLGSDYYVFDGERQELRGERSGETFRLGQKVSVKLAGVHVGLLEIDLQYKKEDKKEPFRKREEDSRAEGISGGERGRYAFARKKSSRTMGKEEGKRRERYASYALGNGNAEDDGEIFRGRRFESRRFRKREQIAPLDREHGFKKPRGKRFEDAGEYPRSEGRSFLEREDVTGGREPFSQRKKRHFSPNRGRCDEHNKPRTHHADGNSKSRSPHGEESFRPDGAQRGSKKGRRKEREAFRGAPEDFFTIHIEQETPIHRFGKRKH